MTDSSSTQSDETLSADQLSILYQSLTTLFSGTAAETLTAFCGKASARSLAVGEILMSEWETANDVYVLLSGRCGFYTQNAEQQLRLMETVDRPGELIGAQSLLEGRQFRSASVIALDTTTLAVLRGETFRKLLRNDKAAADRLSARTVRYALNKLGVLAAELAQQTELQNAPQAAVRQFPAGTTLYQAGQPAEHAWFLLAGEVALTRADSTLPSETIRAGLLFGQADVLAATPRREYATAVTAVEVLSVSAEVLRSCQQQGGRLGTILTALTSAHKLPQLGTVYRYMAQVDQQPCIVSDYTQPAGSRIRVRYFPHLPATVATREEPLTDTITLTAPDGSCLLVLTKSGAVIGLTVLREWDQLPSAMSLILRNASLADWQQRAFESTGDLLLENAASRTPAGAEIICACTNATASMLRSAARSATCVEDLTRLTGAGGICGGCRGRLPVFLGQMEVSLCRIQRAPLATGSIKVRLETVDETPLPQARAGQFVRVEALVDGAWIGRPYTLTDASPSAFELGVKLEQNGFFSNWLNNAAAGTLVRVLPPQGDVCPAADDPRPLLYIVAGIGVTPAMAAIRKLASSRNVHVLYSYRSADSAAYLDDLLSVADAGKITLTQHCTADRGRLDSQHVTECVAALGAAEVVVCGPGDFNRMVLSTLAGMPGMTLRADSFDHPQRGAGLQLMPGGWRKKDFKPDYPAGPPIPLKSKLPAAEQAAQFLREFEAECPGRCQVNDRIQQAQHELAETGVWNMTPEELGFAARIAWRNAERCVGRLYWKGLHLRDCRQLTEPALMAEALFDHLRFAWNGGDLRPAISVFSPGTRDVPGPRLWNPQLLRYAGYRLRSGKQMGDPAQNAVTEHIMRLGWEPAGTDFDLLPLVIQTAEHGPRMFELPADCRPEVRLSHPQQNWLLERGLKWYAIPAVADMALDAGGFMYRLIPFNGWYLNTEIAARNLTDTNRYNLLPELAERMGLDISSERTLWRDRSMLMLHEAVLHSFDRAGVKIADHHSVCHEFLEFCRNEQAVGREPNGKWMWLVPPFSSAATVLYQEPFRDRAFKPAYCMQKPVWESLAATTQAAQP